MRGFGNVPGGRAMVTKTTRKGAHKATSSGLPAARVKRPLDANQLGNELGAAALIVICCVVAILLGT